MSGGKTFPKAGKLFPRQQSSTLFVSAFATSGRWHRAFANLNLGIVKVQQDLHIEPLSAAGTLPEMIGLGLSRHQHRGRASFQDLIFECRAFRIVLLEPFVRGDRWQRP